MSSRFAICALAALAFAFPAAAQVSEESQEMASDGAVGAAAGLSSLVYAPLKVVYAAGGSLVAGLAYVLSGGDEEVARPILDASVRGDYVVTPDHLRGEKTLEFIGRGPDQPALGSGEADVSAKPPRDGDAGASWQ